MHEQLYAGLPGGYPQSTVLDPHSKVPRQFATHILPPAGSQPKLRLSTHGEKLACFTSSQWRTGRGARTRGAAAGSLRENKSTPKKTTSLRMAVLATMRWYHGTAQEFTCVHSETSWISRGTQV